MSSQESKFSIPAYLIPSEEELSGIRREQSRLRSLHPSMDKHTAALQYAENEVELALQNLQAFEKSEIDDETRMRLVSEEHLRLTSNLLILGRFAEAREWASSAAQLAEINRLEESAYKDDSERCDCPDDNLPVGADSKAIPRHFTKQFVFSPKHNRVMPLIECAKCGHTNITASHNVLHLDAAQGTAKPDEEILLNA